jgi:hypothetical protein
MAPKKSAFPLQPQALAACTVLAALAGSLLAGPALAQNYPITPGQRSTANQVAQAGVPLSELAPDAPDEYTVKRGDTLWAISGIFLRSPWRWPELWGMNMDEVRNPHRIYPGQQLVLDKSNGRATLRVRQASSADGMPTDTIRVSPRTRIGSLADSSVPTLDPGLLEPFLAEPIILNEDTLALAPRIVAAADSRVLITRGDRAYARGVAASPLMLKDPNRSEGYRVFRDAKPLRDPLTKAVLGYEAQYLGQALVVRSETTQPVAQSNGETRPMPVPATIDIQAVKEEMRVGDRLLPEPPRQFSSYVPRAPQKPVEGAIVSVYGSAVALVGQNQVVVINKGTADGIESGHVMAILRDGRQVLDRSQPGERTQIKLPNERSGLLMVFRPFERLSYALVLEINDEVNIGDRVVNPR